MTGAGLLSAWALSVLPFLLDAWSGGALGVPGASRLGLAALPWLALAGMPRAGPAEDAARTRRRALVPLALALPPLALGAGLDLAGHGDARALALRGAVAAALILAWSVAAELARPAARRAPYGATWLVLVPASATLHVALAWVPLTTSSGAGGSAGAGASWWLANPLLWAFRWTRAGGAGAGNGGVLLAPAAAAAACAVARRSARRASESAP